MGCFATQKDASPRMTKFWELATFIGRGFLRRLGSIGVDFDGAEDQVFQGADEGGRIADGGHHAKTLDTPFFGVRAAIDVDFVESFDVLGDERNGDDHGFLDAVVAKLFDGAEERRFEPLGRAQFALKTDLVNLRPVGKTGGTLFADETNGFRDVFGIGIPLLDKAHGEAMGAEKKMDSQGVRKLAETLADVRDERFDVERMIVEIFDGALGKRVDRFTVNATPLFEAAERSSVGIMGIQREKDEFIQTASRFEGGDGVFGERLPVAHSRDGDGIDVGSEGLNETSALAFSEKGDRRAATNHGVAGRDRRRAFFGDVAGERAANEVEWA